MRAGVASGKRSYTAPVGDAPRAAAVRPPLPVAARAKANTDAAHYARPREPGRYRPPTPKGYQ